MTRLWAKGEAIAMKMDGPGNLLAFTWKGRRHTVQRVRERWQVDSDWWSEGGRAYREYFAITTTAGMLCVLYYDLLDEQWYLARVYD